jgi:hypothetical protein
MPRVTHVKKARKAIPSAGIEIGDSYYWWKFGFGGKRISKTYPKQSQLTQSEFLSTLYDLQERLDEVTMESEFEEFKQTLMDDIQTLRDETEEKLNNMPDQLQQADTGQLLQDRIDALDQWIGDIDNVETEIDEDEFEASEEFEDFFDPDSEESRESQKERYDEQVREEKEQWIDSKKQEIVEEFQNCTCDVS